MKILVKLFGLLCIAGGIALFSSPMIATENIKQETKQYITQFKQKEKKNKLNKEDDPRYQEIEEYNEKIYENHQKDFRDVNSYQSSPISLKGFKNGKFGYIKIPKMNVKLPLYVGASDSHLAQGAAILGQTSIPVGEIDTNSVIAGHRGYQGAPFFREIEKLDKGDTVTIVNPWDTLEYEVTGIDVISPFNTDAVMIQEGRDMITLVTCHPYRSGGKYRYIVYCTRKGTKPSRKGNESYQLLKTSTQDINNEDNVRRGGALLLAFLFLSALAQGIKSFIQERRSKKRSKRL